VNETVTFPQACLLTWNESDRLAALESYHILDTPPEESFEDVVRLVAEICDAPIAAVNLIARERQWFKAEIGLGVRETPLDVSICAQAILQRGVFVIADTRLDPRTNCNPLVTGAPYLRFYAGALLETRDGLPLGTLCVLDDKPRPQGLTPKQAFALQALAGQVMAQIELRRVLEAQRESERKIRAITDTMPQIVWSTRCDGHYDYHNRRWHEYTGLTEAESAGSGSGKALHPDDRGRAAQVWREALRLGSDYECEYRLRGSDGQYRWFIGRAMPIRDEQGRIERWFGTCTDIQERKLAEQARELVSHELSHRIKNIFAVVGGIISLSARRDPQAKPFADALRQRMGGLAQGLEDVRPGSSAMASQAVGKTLFGLLCELVSPYQFRDRERIAVSGEDVDIGRSSATALALIVHEQATNAMKYGALSNDTGSVAIVGERLGDGYRLTWCERGGPGIAVAPAKVGFGTMMADRTINGQLGGTIERDWSADGLTVRVSLPRDRLQR
jgi:PAS domain S-box-containing protein